MHFFLTSMVVVYDLSTPILADGDETIVEEIRKRGKGRNDEYVCRDLIFNVIIESRDAIFDWNGFSSIPMIMMVQRFHHGQQLLDVANLPPSCKPLGSKWIFQRKMKDVMTTFLNEELDDEVYMNQPQGFIMPSSVPSEVAPSEVSPSALQLGSVLFVTTCYCTSLTNTNATGSEPEPSFDRPAIFEVPFWHQCVIPNWFLAWRNLDSRVTNESSTEDVVFIRSGINASWYNLLANHIVILAVEDTCLPILTLDEVIVSNVDPTVVRRSFDLVQSSDLVQSFDLVQTVDLVQSFDFVRSFDWRTRKRIVMANPNPRHLLDYDEEEDPEMEIEEEEPEEEPVEEPEPLPGHGDQFDAHPNPQPGNMSGWVDDDDDDVEEEEDEENEDADMEEDDDAEIIFPYEVQGDQTPPPRDESSDSDSEPEAEEADDEPEAEDADDELEVEEAGVEPEAEGADVELEAEEPDGVPEAVIGAGSQRPFAIRDFPIGEPLSPDRIFDFPEDELEPHPAYDFFAPAPLPGMETDVTIRLESPILSLFHTHTKSLRQGVYIQLYYHYTPFRGKKSSSRPSVDTSKATYIQCRRSFLHFSLSISRLTISAPTHLRNLYVYKKIPSQEVAEPVAEAEEEQVITLVVDMREGQMDVLMIDMEEDLAVLFGEDDDFKDHDFKNDSKGVDEDEAWEVNEEWLMAPVTPPPVPAEQPPSVYEVGGPSTTVAEGSSLPHLAPGLFVPPFVIKDLKVAAGVTVGELGLRVYAVEGQVQVMMSQMDHVMGRWEQVGAQVEQGQQTMALRDKMIVELTQQVQALQIDVQQRDT
nr:hypothetical protein [Tanacetum cinerariifolium]